MNEIHLLKKQIAKLKATNVKQKNELLTLSETKKILNLVFDMVAGNHWLKDKNGVYRDCNSTMVLDLGLKSKEDIIGKTDFELPWRANAKNLVSNDQVVMKTGQIQMGKEELVTDRHGVVRTFMVSKAPLRDQDGNIAGTVGCSIDITEQKKIEEDLKIAKETAEAALKSLKQAQIKEKKQRKETARLMIENATHKAEIEAQGYYKKIVEQAAHDLGTPLSALKTLSVACAELPEEDRIFLRHAVERILDITYYLLNHYRLREEEEGVRLEEGKQGVLLATTLMDCLSEKRYQYRDVAVEFEDEVGEGASFVFIEAQPGSFRRMISNVVNNAVQALDGKAGKVKLTLAVDAEWAEMSISDTGKGMRAEVVEKIEQGVSFTQGKEAGHGIGLTQVRETLRTNAGEMKITSAVGKGTTVKLRFSRCRAPVWCAEGMRVTPHDTILILDDDPSIHGAWHKRFSPLLKRYSGLRLKHVHVGEEALKWIGGLTEAEQAKVYLLTDFELLNQPMNGLGVIAASGLRRTILVTSYYMQTGLQEEVMRLKTKMLPKQLVYDFGIRVDAHPQIATTRRVDAILVDDEVEYLALRQQFLNAQGIAVDVYSDAETFRSHWGRYDKGTPIFLDNEIGRESGMVLAKELHALGYTHLFLLSGGQFHPGALPDYLTPISKVDLEQFDRVLAELRGKRASG